MVTPMSQPDWLDFPLKTSALGSRPDSIATSFKPPALLHASPPVTVAAELSQLFRVKKPFTFPENERSHVPALKPIDRKSTRLNSSHLGISYAVFCLKKKKKDARCSD